MTALSCRCENQRFYKTEKAALLTPPINLGRHCIHRLHTGCTCLAPRESRASIAPALKRSNPADSVLPWCFLSLCPAARLTENAVFAGQACPFRKLGRTNQESARHYQWRLLVPFAIAFRLTAHPAAPAMFPGNARRRCQAFEADGVQKQTKRRSNPSNRWSTAGC